MADIPRTAVWLAAHHRGYDEHATGQQGSTAFSTSVRIEPYTSDRRLLRPLFELAEDSPSQLDSYIDAGRVLVALSGGQVVGHLQLLEVDEPDVVEIKSMAVRREFQRRGVGGMLISRAVQFAAESGASALLVGTAAADVGNLRFYQRQDFRMLMVDPDAFTPANGYPVGLLIDGIPLRDRVWLSRRVREES